MAKTTTSTRANGREAKNSAVAEYRCNNGPLVGGQEIKKSECQPNRRVRLPRYFQFNSPRPGQRASNAARHAPTNLPDSTVVAEGGNIGRFR